MPQPYCPLCHRGPWHLCLPSSSGWKMQSIGGPGAASLAARQSSAHSCRETRPSAGLCEADTCTRLIPGMSLSVPHAVVTPAKGTAAGAGGIQPTLLPAAPSAVLCVQGLCVCGGALAAAETGAETGTAPAAPWERGRCLSPGCSGPWEHTKPQLQLQLALPQGCWESLENRSPWFPFYVQTTRWTRMSSHRDPGFASMCPLGDGRC